MSSAVLVSSNPTNLVLSGAFGLSFITYASRLALPVVASSLAVYPLLFWLFGRRGRTAELIPVSIELPEDADDARAALVDPPGAIFGSVLVCCTLAALVGTSPVHVPVYQITVPPAVLMLVRDAWHDWSHHRKTAAVPPAGFPMQELPSSLPSPAPSAPSVARPPQSLASLAKDLQGRIKAAFPTVCTIASRLPVPLIPFAFLMFILVQGLGSTGWVELFARWWAAWMGATSGSVVGAVGGMVFVSCVLCNVGHSIRFSEEDERKADGFTCADSSAGPT
jgi:Na+/H+ antiporter NhaD/arsenite permease-like protein